MRISKMSILSVACILLLILYLPTFTMLVPAIIRKAIFVCALAFFILQCVIERNGKELIVFGIMVLLALIYYIGAWCVSLPTTYFVNSIVCWIFYSTACLLKKEENIKPIFKLLIVLILINAITTIIGNVIYPNASRYLSMAADAYSLEERRQYYYMNIGSFGQTYGMVFFVGGMFLLYKKTKQMKYMIYTIICEIAVISAQLTFAIILSIFLLICLIIDFRNKLYAGLFILSLPFVLLCVVNAAEIVKWLSDIAAQINVKTVSGKLNDLYVLLKFSQKQGDVVGRFDLYSLSLSTFAQVPIGIVWFNKPVEHYMGFHSEFFDLLAFFGVSIIPVIVLVVRHYKKNVCMDSLGFKFLYVFLILCVLNPVFYYPQIFLGAFLFPMMIESTTHIEEQNFILNNVI